MRHTVILLCVAAVGTVAVASWLRLTDEGPVEPAPEPIEMPAKPQPQFSAPNIPREGPAAPLPPPAPVPSGKSSSTVSPVPAVDSATGLQADADGHLVMNIQVRDAIERLLSGPPAELEQGKQAMVANLPPMAGQEALEMAAQFVNYRAALRQALPQTPQAMSEQDAGVMLETVHDLRVTYFGMELTEIFFGAEEAAGR